MEYKINEELLNATIQYLGTKPFAEVYKLVAALQGLEKIESKPRTPEDVKK